jgi:phosphatidylglycerophosphatase A
VLALARDTARIEYPRLMNVVALAWATCLGVGYVPFAPGTFGSLAGVVLWYLLPNSPSLHVVAIAIVFIIGSWSSSVAERHFQSTDPAPVVLDEVMGMWITLLMNPVGWLGMTIAFVLFRVFDVIKPYPANKLEHLPGGIGVMADDGMAAVYANLALRVTIYVFSAVGHWRL